MGIDEQIANLTPEKRDLLLKKLKERRPKPEMAQPAAVGGRLFDPERDQNFRLHASRPGILDSLVYQVTQRRKPGPTEIEVEVFASSLNFGDVMVAIGLYPKSPVMGSDCAGRVVATGERVDHVKVGDEVIVMAVDVSCFSRYITVAGFAAVPKPRYLSFEEAATIPTVFLTVYYSLYSLAQIEKGERILIQSGTGGVGLAAIQYARWMDAEIYTTVGTPEKREYLQSLGIERVFNSRSMDFAEGVMEATGGEGVDVVLNGLAGEAIPKGLSTLRPLGRFVELGRRDFFQNTPLGLAPFYEGLSFHSVSLGSLLMMRPRLFQLLMQKIVEGFDQKIFQVLPSRLYPATDIAKAFEYMAQGIHIGKIAVTFRNQQIHVTA